MTIYYYAVPLNWLCTPFDRNLAKPERIDAMPYLDKAGLEMTAIDHDYVGSTPPHVLVANPGKTLAETMDDDAIQEFVSKEINIARRVHADVMNGERNKEDVLKTVRDSFLLPNINYLRRIGRLPEEFKDTDFEQELAV